MSRRAVILVSAAILLLLAIYPFDVTVVPEWRVKVVDQEGKPVPGAYVLLFAPQWTLDLHSEEAICTNGQGEVDFHRRSVPASVARRVTSYISKLSPHSSPGPDVKVGVEALGYGDKEGDRITVDWDGHSNPVTTTLNFHKCPEGLTGYGCNFDYKYFFGVNSSAKAMQECQASPGRIMKPATPFATARLQ